MDLNTTILIITLNPDDVIKSTNERQIVKLNNKYDLIL